MTTETTNEQGNSTDKILETAVRNTAIQMGCWTAIDDYILITSIMHLRDLERVYERVKFSMKFSLDNIRDRWRCLLYDPSISKMIMNKIQQLSMSQIENLQVPLNDEEEQLIATIPSHTIPNLLDEQLSLCLNKNTRKFWSNRTIEYLRENWFQMRNEGKLNDQKATIQQCSTAQNHPTANKLSSLLLPFEFDLLSRDKQQQFKDKTELPYALLHANSRLYCMYTDQLTFGTVCLDQQFDISFDNTTSIHLQGLILRKAGLFYIANNGEHPFRVNDALLHSNEASPLGTRAVIKVHEHTMAFQAIELPQS